jgi:hypothetical protein
VPGQYRGERGSREPDGLSHLDGRDLLGLKQMLEQRGV